MTRYFITGYINTSALDLDQFVDGLSANEVRDFLTYDIGPDNGIDVSLSEVENLTVKLVEEGY